MATAEDYSRVMGKAWDDVSDKQMRNVWENHAKSYVRAFWKQEVGRKFPYKIRIGSGNRNTWLQGSVFTVNPDAGWSDINHDMSHFIHWRKTGLSHQGGHMSVERDGAALIRRRFLEEGPPPVKPQEDLIEKRAASVDRRIVGWEKKLKRAKTALKKLKKQKRYYVKKLADDRLNFRLERKPRKKPAKRLNVFEFGEKHGVKVEKEQWEGYYSYYVTPLVGCDTDADPYYGDHTVHDAKEARERILHYASVASPSTPEGGRNG